MVRFLQEMPRICFSLWSGWPDGWGAPGKRKTRGQNSSLPGPEQGLGSRPPASQRGTPRLRNTRLLPPPPLLHVFGAKYKHIAYRTPWRSHSSLPWEHPALSLTAQGDNVGKGLQLPPPEVVTLVLGTPSSPSLPGTPLLPACLLSSRGQGSHTMLHPSCGQGTAKPP